MNHGEPKIIGDQHLKPREERDFKEIYPDLDERAQLRVIVKQSNESANFNTSNNGSSTQNAHIDLKKPTFKKRDNPRQTQNAHPKFSKTLAEYGFQDPGKISVKRQNPSYIRPFSLPESSGIHTIHDLIERKMNQVEYDMDEQDFLYLKNRNDDPQNVIKITHEVFEILITVLENEWDHLEHRMNSLVDSNGGSMGSIGQKLLTLDQTTSNDKYGNDDGIVPGSIYDQKCAVCNDSDCENTNAIVFCDGCDIAVHQECYGIAFIPEGQWLCRKCMINKNRPTECVFCPSKTGAFKQLDNSLWSHVICALWINELYFANPIYMEPIEGMDSIPKSRWKLSCYLCKQKMGACIQCSNRNCFQAYHVTCAKRAGLYMEYTQGIQGAITNKSTLKTYCERHMPPECDVGQVLQGIKKTRLFFHDTKILHDKNVKLSNHRKTANKLNIFKWKTENNTPIAPKLFSDVLLRLMTQLKVENQLSVPSHHTSNQARALEVLPNRTKESIQADLRKISDEICRYWCLKRESKRGAPLIRKNNNLMSSSSILYSSSDGNEAPFDTKELEQKGEFGQLLLGDLDRIISMSTDWIDLQETNHAVDINDFRMIDTVYYPIKKGIEFFLDEINEKIDTNSLIRNYRLRDGVRKKALGNVRDPSEGPDSRSATPMPHDNTNRISMKHIISKNSQYLYESIETFHHDVECFNSIISSENKPSHAIYKLMKRWMKEFNAGISQLYAYETKIKSESSKRRKLTAENLPKQQQDLADDSELDSSSGARTAENTNYTFVDPFVSVTGDQIQFQDYDFEKALEENDLSEVDQEHQEFEQTPENLNLFARFLNGE